MEQTCTVPRWNLSAIYSGFDGTDYTEALHTLDELLDKQQKLLKTAASLKETNADTFANQLVRCIKARNECGALFESLNAFAYSMYSVNTTDAAALNNMALIDEKALRIHEADILFSGLLAAHAQFLPEFFTSFPQFGNYRFLFSEETAAYKHFMPAEQENLAADMQRFGANAWSRLHEQIISNLKDSESGKTFNELRNDAYNADRNVRRESYKKEISLLKKAEIPLAACLNNIKGATVSLNKRRSWTSALEKACFLHRISAKTLNALIGAIEDSLPFWRTYLHTKAKIINLPSCSFYDLFAPLPAPKAEKSCEKTWSFPQAREYIIEKFTGFAQDMGNFAKTAFEQEWIDAEVRKGKVGGAFCIDFPQQKVSRILSNFSGTFSDVTTLAHELGHAYHYHCIKGADYALTHYPMTLAETASIFAETIVMKDMLAKTDGYERANLLETHLSDSCQVLVDILCRFYFEQSVFSEREKSELCAEDFCRLMASAQEKTYGSGLSEERHPYMWAVKTHYYSPDLDFYNFPYAFGLLFAAGLYARYEKEKDTFAETYRGILCSSGSFPCEEICRRAGFDIEQKDFWMNGIKNFEQELADLKLCTHTSK